MKTAHLKCFIIEHPPNAPKKKKETGKLSGTPLNLGRLNNTNFFMLDDNTKLNISQEKVSENIKQKQNGC